MTRSIWNAMIERRPAFIARCSGHNIAGNALCDDGLVIDLSAMRAVRVDPDARLARAGGGATLRDFDHETQA